MTTNLLWVTLGNIAGGGLLVGLAYSYAGREKPVVPAVTRPASASAAELVDPLRLEDERVLDEDEPTAVTVIAATSRSRNGSSKASSRPAAGRPATVRATTTPAAAPKRSTAPGTRRTTTPPPRTRAPRTHSR